MNKRKLKNLFLSILSLFYFSGVRCRHSYLKQSIKDPKALEQAQNYLAKVVNGSASFLKMPPILEPNTSPREYVDTEHGGEFYRIVMGLLVENYSKYKLTDPRTSGDNDCAANREVRT